MTLLAITLFFTVVIAIGQCFDKQVDCRQAVDGGGGSCTMYSIMFYYDSNAARCIPFIYHGCQGNTNRFRTESECVAKCGGVFGSVQLTTPSATLLKKTLQGNLICLKPIDTGCYLDQIPIAVLRFFYDDKSKACRSFYYCKNDWQVVGFDTSTDCSLKCSINERQLAPVPTPRNYVRTDYDCGEVLQRNQPVPTLQGCADRCDANILQCALFSYYSMSQTCELKKNCYNKATKLLAVDQQVWQRSDFSLPPSDTVTQFLITAPTTEFPKTFLGQRFTKLQNEICVKNVLKSFSISVDEVCAEICDRSLYNTSCVGFTVYQAPTIRCDLHSSCKDRIYSEIPSYLRNVGKWNNSK